MQRIDSLDAWYDYRQQLSGSVGFVPTMGALHDGHLSLVQAASEANDHVVVSIFVNPTQFDQQADLDQYPNALAEDLEQLAAAGVAAVFLPTFELMYPDDFAYQMSENELSNRYCGAHRPGHFDGVLTVVLKLFNIVNPTQAYFGEKDYQQLTLIKGMVDALFLPVEIVACPTQREANGLAMSSRNRRLSPAQKKLAPLFYKTLVEDSSLIEKHQRLHAVGFEVDYLSVLDDRLLAAVKLGDIRLIDNVAYPQGDRS